MAQRSKAAKKTAKRTGKKVGETKVHTKIPLGRGWRLSKGGKTVSASLLAVHDLGDRYLVLFKSAV
ncbi:hypothetical protein ML401_28775 [Bradyrhizobium sp. 62B]|uniref:hypothetical protein n=1 Tax=Pseudomonadota TaxID=1224 RepID=UPI001A9E4A69|nr:hypothetical protein [Pseudomonas sp. 100_A]WIW45410.1 hypothetical protein ML401_28775 [Bradyrhizobium sp. 62B]